MIDTKDWLTVHKLQKFIEHRFHKTVRYLFNLIIQFFIFFYTSSVYSLNMCCILILTSIFVHQPFAGIKKGTYNSISEILLAHLWWSGLLPLTFSSLLQNSKTKLLPLFSDLYLSIYLSFKTKITIKYSLDFFLFKSSFNMINCCKWMIF